MARNLPKILIANILIAKSTDVQESRWPPLAGTWALLVYPDAGFYSFAT